MNKNKSTSSIRNTVQKTNQKEHSVPLFLTSSFTFDNSEHARSLFADEIEGNIYSRFSNPNVDELSQKISILEEMDETICTATGMSAIFLSIASFVKSGDHILASNSLFGSTHQILNQILTRWNISTTYIDFINEKDWEKNIRPNTKMVFLETPSNPSMNIIDIQEVSKITKKHKILLNVDNCFATPILQVPSKLGADIVVHSATKFFDGQGRVLGGCVSSNKENIKEIRFLLRHTGPAMSAFNAWLISKSLETLEIRVEKHCENALKLAERLMETSDVINVKYPFLKTHPQYEIAKKQMKMGGGLLSFELKNGLNQAIKFFDSLKMISLSANLGDTKTISTIPSITTHSKLSIEDRKKAGINDGLIRISVGLENIDDIYNDILQAIKNSK